MANFEDQLSMHDEPSAQEMEEMMSQKAHELFELCDKEQKGFITKRDMQRLQSELPLSPEQLEAVFDSLDDDRNGFLTLEEFTGGFGSFLGLNPSEGVHEEDQGEGNVYEEQDDAVEEDRQFHQMMSNLGATHLFDDENTIKSVWSRIRRNEPEVVSNFEDFLYKISNEIRKSKLDFNTLESALKSKSSAHDQEVQKLYEEMEYQIKAEKERVLTEEQTKERQLREAMEHEIKEKDKQLQELVMKHQEMEERLSDLNLVEVETKQENDKLMKEKESLEELLLKSEENLEESKAYINQLRSQQRDEKRERARAALKLTEGIALERESLVKQLDTLKHVNKKLRDDKDEAETRRDWANDAAVSIEEETKQILAEETTAAKQPTSRKKELCKQGSILGNYFGTDKRGWGATESLSEDIESDVEHDGDGTLGHHGIEGDDDVEIDDHEMDDSLNHTNQSQTFNHKHLTNENNAQLLAGQGSEYINGGPTSKKVRKTKKQGSLEDITSSENEAGTKQDGQQSDKSKSHMKKRKKHTSGRDDNRTTADDSQDSNVVASQGLVGNSVDDDWEPDTDNIDIQTASALEEVSAEKNQPHDSLIDSHFSKDTPVASSFGEGEVTVDTRNENSNVTKSQSDETAGEEISNNVGLSAELENMNKTLKQNKEGICENELGTGNSSVTSSKKTTGHLPKKSEKVARLAEIYENENSEDWKNDNKLSKSYEMKEMKGVDTHQFKTGIGESFDDSDHSKKSQPDKKTKVKRKKKTYPCNSLPCARGVPMDTWSDELSFTEGSDSDEAVSMAALHNEQLRSRHRRYRKSSTTQRGQPVGADEDGTTDPRPPKRERLFKVVFVGDSGVGKSSFIHRFCNDQFNPSFSATIGVDFQVKSVEMEDQIIVLQLWDTAGQERFRSITKQYFRKADGVVVLYDVTSEASFISVKNWMVSVQEGVEEGTIILMVGNKTDLSENDDKRVVKLKDGSKLAMSYDALFYETSAKNGTNIKEAVEAMASLLKDKQDEDLEKALHLQDDPVKKKKGCCG